MLTEKEEKWLQNLIDECDDPFTPNSIAWAATAPRWKALALHLGAIVKEITEKVNIPEIKEKAAIALEVAENESGALVEKMEWLSPGASKSLARKSADEFMMELENKFPHLSPSVNMSTEHVRTFSVIVSAKATDEEINAIPKEFDGYKVESIIKMSE